MIGEAGTVGHVISAAMRELRGRCAPVSDLGVPLTLQTSAAYWLSAKVGLRSEDSSFGAALGGIVLDDDDRLVEAPYLAALGYRVDASPGEVLPDAAGAAIGRVVRRAPHTIERTGIADDPVCLVGLFLLARAMGEERSLHVLSSLLAGLAADESQPAYVMLFVALADAFLVSMMRPWGEPKGLELAVAAISHCVSGDVGGRLFPCGTGVEYQFEMLRHVSAGTLGGDLDDWGAMLLLVALEVALARTQAHVQVGKTDGMLLPSRKPSQDLDSSDAMSPSPLFTWLHLSDIHFGHPAAAHRSDQTLVLQALRRDLASHASRDVPAPLAIVVTGDIAFSGTKRQYDQAATWLADLATLFSLPDDRIFFVPGNHDIDHDVDKKDRSAARLVRELRDPRDPGEYDKHLDEALAHGPDRSLLTSRLAAYLDFASAYPSTQSPDPLYWTHTLVSNNLPIRLLGLSTPLLSAAGDVDKARLRLGKTPWAATLVNADRARELTVVLTHHPFREGWLFDQRDADNQVRACAHVHLFGHIHDPDNELAGTGGGNALIRVAAGAVHCDPRDPPEHGYSIAAVIPMHDGSLRLRIWPRRWSERNKEFRADVQGTPDGRPVAEHVIPGLRAP